jgi:hypothetical protein
MASKGHVSDETVGVLSIAGFGAVLLYVYELFRARDILNDYFKAEPTSVVRVSALGTWLFGIVYLQAKINKHIL